MTCVFFSNRRPGPWPGAMNRKRARSGPPRRIGVDSERGPANIRPAIMRVMRDFAGTEQEKENQSRLCKGYDDARHRFKDIHNEASFLTGWEQPACDRA